MEQKEMIDLLRQVASGTMDVEQAALKLKEEPFEDLGFAKIDHHRAMRQGVAEVIYGEGKTPEQIFRIAEAMKEKGQKAVLITRMNKESAIYVGERLELQYDEVSRIGFIGEAPIKDGDGKIVVATGGTSDIPVAEEAARTAETLGNEVIRLYDVGVAGVHRLLGHLGELMEARVIIAVAGMEGALASVIGGLVDCPVIAVPTSVGYGASFGGVSALLSMLNSCASGVSVVNIDNGFGADQSHREENEGMRTLYLDCGMGAAGDMLTASLLQLFSEPVKQVKKLNDLKIPGVKYQLVACTRGGIRGYQVRVFVKGQEEENPHTQTEEQIGHKSEEPEKHTQEHGHHSMSQIVRLINRLEIEDQVKQGAVAVYKLIAKAEGKAHGQRMDEIHFHEVGTMDAVADVVAVCYLLNELQVDQILASPVRVGYGHVKCAHGILPVPAPATAYLMKEIPMYAGDLEGEFCTPTGAALLKHFVKKYEQMPVLQMEEIGYGFGKREYERLNCVRAILGETQDKVEEEILELCCNLDDMTSEEIGYATELLIKEGALDVYTSSIQMKKNRPGILLTCMCRAEQKEYFLQLIFKHTSTLGVREYFCRRYGLKRKIDEVQTEYGTVHVKRASGYGAVKEKLEYEDVSKIAEEHSWSVAEARNRIYGKL